MASAELVTAPIAARAPTPHAPSSTSSSPSTTRSTSSTRRSAACTPIWARSFPFAWRIVIADNASTDATSQVAAALAAELPDVEVLRLAQKGRGRALRAAWMGSDADVVCYMDVDLSTGPARAPAADRAAGLRPQRRRDRHAPRARRPGGARRQARAHLAQLQPPAAPCAARALQRRAVRVQGAAHGRRAPAGARRQGRGLVLRHGTADPRPARGPADPRGAGRLGRRPRLAGRHRRRRRSATCAASRACCAAASLPRFLAVGVLLDGGVRAALRAAARAARPRRARTRRRSPSPRSANTLANRALLLRRARARGLPRQLAMGASCTP